jgi:hypothetical protein
MSEQGDVGSMRSVAAALSGNAEDYVNDVCLAFAVELISAAYAGAGMGREGLQPRRGVFQRTA